METILQRYIILYRIVFRGRDLRLFFRAPVQLRSNNNNNNNQNILLRYLRQTITFIIIVRAVINSENIIVCICGIKTRKPNNAFSDHGLGINLLLLTYRPNNNNNNNNIIYNY
jgi:hypothetical protein